MQNKNGVKMQNKNVEMKSLLRTILEEAKKNKVMFRYSALNHYEWGNFDDIDDWSYDIDRVIEVIKGWDCLHDIQFLKANKVMKDNKKVINIKTIKEKLESESYGYKVGNQSITYSADCEFEQFSITIREGYDAYQLEEDESTSILLSSDGFLCWEAYDTLLDCFQDYSVSLDSLFKKTSINEIMDNWLEKFKLFEKGLL